ncbi:MAG: hypothetical protein COV07_03520 [Candidatus Vogelbacteria bacterium CG10_big_fil_rev_8_21_14_0_10_45_14]|uniref:Recombinase family protein n=2 Tax=Parcubacteria group TaxID=1794811 RepID=A0A2H0DZW4_9BACT|nr:MAG: hypothetical protein COW81_00290 [Candidatus Campbellbacteria bacterium CG22_combo_CG10-13_8_21_14_all_36_13]PIR46573.1 MAG: hypothetical protein COV07_03520 [Candidatus Vogelbacteria bacterium CG10_big_fil_rev_8_21_14_0_10_45_14]
MKYFLYARKSTDVEDKQVLSIEAQLSELRSIARSQELEITEEFIEKKSAKKPGRVIFEEMLRRIEKGEAQGIVCWKVDRLSRNPVDSGRISWMLQQNIIQKIITHDRVYLPQDNVLIMSVEFGMANQYIRDLSQNTRRGLIAKARKGEFPTIAPVGYLNDVRNKMVVIDRKKAKIIKEAFELYSQGESRLEDIADFLYEKNVRTVYGNKFHRDRVKFVLSNPFYYGHFYYSGEIYEGKHTPIISKKLFDKVQDVLCERGRPAKPRNEPMAFCGLLRCATCGMMITAENKVKRQKNGNIHKYVYYRCTKKSKTISCNEGCVREEELTE